MYYYLDMARTDPQLNLRLPAELKDKLEEAATNNNRTLTSETVDRLIASFEQPAKPAEIAFVLSRMEMRAAEAELDLSQMKSMLAEIYWSLKMATMIANMPAESQKQEIVKRLPDWESTLKDAEGYIGNPKDVKTISNELTDRLAAFTKAFDSSKIKYEMLNKDE